MSLVTPKKGYKSVPWLFGKEIEIPEEWNWEQIKKVSEKLVVGFVGTCDPYYVKKGGIPMLRTTNVKEGKLDLINLKYVTEQFHNKNKKSQIKENDLLISRHGESGESCLVTGLNEANCMNIVIVRAINKILNNQYFEIAFNSLIVRKQIRRTTAGGVQGVVNTSEIAKVKILLPPLPEQQKIATILSNVDNLIESTEKVITHSKKVKTGLMQKLLTRGIGHTKFKTVHWHFNSKLQIPDNWELLPIRKISQINSKSIDQQYDNKEINYVDISSIKNFNIQKFEKFLTSERPSRAQRIIQNGDILVSTVRPYLQAFSIVENKESNFICSTGFTVLKPHNSHITNILFNFIKSEIFETYVIRLMEGMAYPAITSKIVGDCLIPVPTNENEIHLISETFANVDAQIDSQIQYKEKLQRLKKSLMQKLLTGEVRV